MSVTLAGNKVGHVGYGLMMLTWTPVPPADEVSFAAMKAAADAGATAWSSATFYGNGKDHAFDNLKLIGRFFKKYPEYKDKITLVLKGGAEYVGGAITYTNDININRQLLKTAQEALGDFPISVYSPSRLGPGIDVLEYFAPFEALRKEGLFGRVGTSEVSATTLRTLTGAGIDVAVVEIEVSLWSYEKNIQDVIAFSNETGIPVFAYSPLGRGFLTRTYKTPEDIPKDAFIRHLPRFQGENFYHNLKLVDILDEMAAKRGITTSQLAIAWVASLGPQVIAIPGSSNAKRVTENSAAAAITLSPEDKKEIDDVLAKFELKGGRYFDAMSPHLMV